MHCKVSLCCQSLWIWKYWYLIQHNIAVIDSVIGYQVESHLSHIVKNCLCQYKVLFSLHFYFQKNEHNMQGITPVPGVINIRNTPKKRFKYTTVSIIFTWPVMVLQLQTPSEILTDFCPPTHGSLTWFLSHHPFALWIYFKTC